MVRVLIVFLISFGKNFGNKESKIGSIQINRQIDDKTPLIIPICLTQIKVKIKKRIISKLSKKSINVISVAVLIFLVYVLDHFCSQLSELPLIY